MPYDMARVLDETYTGRGLVLTIATVVIANPLAVRYGTASDAIPANRVADYAPVIGDTVYVIQGGRGKTVVIGKVALSTDPGVIVNPPAGGIWTDNLAPNGNFERDFSYWAYDWFNSMIEPTRFGGTVVSPFLSEVGNTRAVQVGVTIPYGDTPWSPNLSVSHLGRIPVKAGEVYRIEADVRQVGDAPLIPWDSIWFGFRLANTQTGAGNAVDGVWGWRDIPPVTIAHISREVTIPSGWTWGGIWFQGATTVTITTSNMKVIQYDNVMLKRKL